MKKLFILLFSLIIFIPGLKAEENYYDWEQIEVEELPEASEVTMNKVYVNNDSYYITNSTYLEGTSRPLVVGDNICSGRIYFKGIDSDYYNSLSSYSYTRIILFTPHISSLPCYVSGNAGKASIRLFGSSVYIDYQSVLPIEPYYLDLSSICTENSNNILINTIDDNYRSLIDNLISFETDGVYTYSWQEVSKNQVIEILLDERDFYLFYSFEDIKNFDILSNYDLESFSDYQKIIVTLGFNSLFLGIIGLSIYIIIKFIYKGVSLLFRF